MRQAIRDRLISGKELRQGRLEAQLSLVETEKLSGISKGRIQRIETGAAQRLAIACAGDTDFKRRLGEIVWWQNAVVLGKEFASRKETPEFDLSKTVELAILARRHDATCAVKIDELLETTTIPDAVAHTSLAGALKSDRE